VTSSGKPLVSVGLPVYNGEKFLARALDSLLGQTIRDIELIISDNASADGTQAICEEYARRDRRVRYLRQAANIGAPRNWNVVAREARGEFFKWAAAADICVPHNLESCVQAMRRDSSVVMCYGRTQFIDEQGKPLEVIDSDIDAMQERPSERFLRVCTLLSLNNAQCGVIRLDVLRRTGYDRLYPSGDLALTAELVLYGKCLLLPEILVLRRKSPATFTSMLGPLERQRFYDPGAKAPMRFIHLRRHLDHLASIARAPIPTLEKLRASRAALRVARWDRGELWRELVSGFARSNRAA
jgi:glycosyltransferase involved in cell wall biosynthesis